MRWPQGPEPPAAARFIGIILLPIIGNAAEHYTAIKARWILWTTAADGRCM